MSKNNQEANQVPKFKMGIFVDYAHRTKYTLYYLITIISDSITLRNNNLIIQLYIRLENNVSSMPAEENDDETQDFLKGI